MADVTERCTAVRFADLLDSAIDHREPSRVNFSLLYALLSNFLKHFNAEEVKVPINAGNETGKTHENTVNLFGFDRNRNYEDRLKKVESQLDALNALPDNREVLEKALEPPEKGTRVIAQLWQAVHTRKRIDAAEEGLSKLSSLVDDLLSEIRRLTEENNQLTEAMKHAQEGASLKGLMTRLEEKLCKLEEWQNNTTDLLKDVVHLDALRGLVFWHSLGAAIRGINQITTASSGFIEEVGGSKIIQKLPDEFVQCPDPDLSSTLKKLGDMALAFDGVIKRTEKLEESLKLKADRSDLQGLGVPPELLERISSLEVIVKELAKEREKNTKLIKALQDGLAILKEQISRISNAVTSTQSELKHVRELIDEVRQFAEDLDGRKADGVYVDSELLKKADKDETEDYMKRHEYKEANEELHKLIEDLFTKILSTETDLRALVSSLENGLDGKLDREEFEQLRNWLEKRFKALASKMRSINCISPDGPISDDAAGLRRGLMQHYHCISCDRPLQVAGSPDTATFLSERGFPSSKSSRPYTTYELDGFRQHYQGSSCGFYDVYGIPRRCGGVHTTTTPFRRVNRGNTDRSPTFDDEAARTTPFLSPRDEVKLRGYDGQIYRGRMMMQDMQLEGLENVNSERSPRSTRDDGGIKLPPLPKPTKSYGILQVSFQFSTENSQILKKANIMGVIKSSLQKNTIEESDSRRSPSPTRSGRKVQLVPPRSKSPECLAMTASGYAVVTLPSAVESGVGEERSKLLPGANKRKRTVGDLACEVTGQHPHGGTVENALGSEVNYSFQPEVVQNEQCDVKEEESDNE
ncbi:unnamed protein product [Calicophoron daubneyi]|uniref:DUF4795 domain-containing protein n=1 Tax=Calicophoron daubneyi TaxID=300641 RepID=A0AAV2TFU9_CALDB